MPDPDVVRPDERRQDEREGPLRDLRAHHDFLPRHPVGHDAAEEGEEKHRSRGQEAVDAEEERGAGQRVDEPRLRQHLHEGADGGGDGAEPEETEVAVAEGAEGAGETPLGDGLGHGARVYTPVAPASRLTPAGQSESARCARGRWPPPARPRRRRT